MNVLSLFDGMSCGQVALERVGIKVDNYYASEIDKYAIHIAQKNYHNTIQIGNIEFVTKDMLSGINIDLVLGGSPCQGFSFAGKQLNFDDPRSKLFFEYVRILKELKSVNPNVKFLLENVRMTQINRDVISKYLGVEPIYIDSNTLSAQNRKRFYWTNIKGVKQPDDKGILLKDILEPNCCAEFFLNDDQIARAIEKYKAKIWKSGNRMGNMRFPDETNRKSKYIVAAQIIGDRSQNHIFQENGYVKISKDLSIKTSQDKASCLTGGAHSGGNHSDMDLLAQLSGKIRRLTPLECERLQTLPEGYTEGVSPSQRYKMIGNGWTVDVITHILKGLKS